MNGVNYVFASLWAGWLSYWVVSALGSTRPSTRSGGRWRFTLLAIVVVASLWVWRFPSHLEQRARPPRAVGVYAGLVLTACGLGFAIWARRILAANWSAVPTIKKDHALVQHGPYALVRHPIYTGLLLAIFGTCLAQGRDWLISVFGVTTVVLIVKLKAEEALMAGEFPDAYGDYRRRVKALIPFLY